MFSLIIESWNTGRVEQLQLNPMSVQVKSSLIDSSMSKFWSSSYLICDWLFHFLTDQMGAFWSPHLLPISPDHLLSVWHTLNFYAIQVFCLQKIWLFQFFNIAVIEFQFIFISKWITNKQNMTSMLSRLGVFIWEMIHKYIWNFNIS